MDGKDGEKKMGKKWDLDGKILGCLSSESLMIQF